MSTLPEDVMIATELPLPVVTTSSSEAAPSKPKLVSRFRKLIGVRKKEAAVEPPAEGKDPIDSPNPDNNGNEDDGDTDIEDPSGLAKKIRSLIDSLPLSTPGSSRTIPKVPKQIPIARDPETGRPIPPEDACRTHDERIISLLSSATIMNGKGANRESVWSVLDMLGAPSHDTAEGGSGSDSDGDDGGSSHGSDDSSVMLYAPLVPTQDSVVELAETLLINMASRPQTAESYAFIQSLSFWPPNFWPFTLWHHDSSEVNPPTPANPPSPVRVWVPSTTKLSCQVMWWGYRLYLPPPVLAILSDKQLEATKRAAMITTALTWFFSHLPLSVLPLPLRPAALLLQKLVPYLGYIGTFISWSWSTIKSYDIGYGVYLTATWVLPVALIPGTWQAYDFPAAPSTPPSPSPSPAPAPAAPVTEPVSPTVPVSAVKPSLPSIPRAPSSPTTDTPPGNETADDAKKGGHGIWKLMGRG
ncbi:hypothetical protein C8J56DRAFT_435157 [Mycena floridula]|nr:hypothetical protein C8J56DRAFT_435157 [Mycena floridula]